MYLLGKFGTILLGLWMIAQPLTFATKSSSMALSDGVSGVVLVVLGLLAFVNQRQWVCWAIALVGVWLQFAPLAFWAPEPVSYLNDVVVGVMAILFSVVLSPDQKLGGASIPPGWSYNPSAWLQRLPIAFLGFLAWMFARYMASYQLGYIDHIVDPVFGDGTEKVITSKISQHFPVPDAGLGALAYTLEVLMACHGGSRRWHTMPWFVVLFAILVIPLGLVSIVLIILQPTIVHAWCLWCLLTAVCMLFMIALAVDEVAAVWQFLKTSKKPFWEAFWKGSSGEGEAHADPAALSYMTKGISIPWNLALTALIGLWLMFAHLSDSTTIIGALAVVFSIISMAEVARAARFLVVLLGACLVASSFPAIWPMLGGLLLVILSIPKGRIKETYGEIDRYIR